jgi:hypothetical protein
MPATYRSGRPTNEEVKMNRQVKDVCEQLEMSLESSAAWRATKAKEHPDDERNAQSAAALARAAREVAALPDDDPRLLRLASIYAAHHDLVIYVEEESSLISRHGFDSPNETTNELLNALVKAAE